MALAEERVLITNDTDFGELVFRLGLPHVGVVLFQFGSEHTDLKVSAIDL